MRNQEAARYARWAAMTAGAIALIVAGVYAQRAIREAATRRAAPPVVPATVQQQSAEFSFSKVEQDRTIFKVRASHATQFKDQNRSLLQDVWITIYGRDGSRNDNIHTRECSYEPKSGAVQCEGDVQIDIQGANPASGRPSDKSLVVKTRNLTFNRESGDAATTEPVDFEFPQGHGHAVGVTYSTRDSIVRLEHGVQMNLAPETQTGGLPVQATGSSLEIRRDTHLVVLNGPAVVQQGDRRLTAEKISIELDAEYHARRAIAEGQPVIHATGGGGPLTIAANQLEGFLNPAGWIERIVAAGNVTCTRQTAAGTDHFSTARVEFTMLPQKNLAKEMIADGGVSLDSLQGAGSRSLKTESLRVTFAPVLQSSQRRAEQQRIESAETLAPATIETKSGLESTTLRARRFVAQFGGSGRPEKLLGHSNVEVRHQVGTAGPQVSTAAELVATLGAAGDWDTLDEIGNVHFQQVDHQASAARARIVRSTDMISLDGSPILTDSQSRSTAASVTINQKSGEIRASGGVVSTYIASAQSSAVNLGSGPAHVSAESLSGSTTSGHIVYLGHARLWQGESVLNADQIELWRDEKRMQAAGHVVAVFPQASGQFGKAAAPSSGPTLWKIHAPSLIYWNDQGKAHLEGGVTAHSQQGSLDSRSLDAFLGPVGASAGATGGAPPGAPSASGGRQLTRALALGGVVVRQGDRLGMADRAEYTASDGKFVLSGGKPTLTDASRDTTTGHSLTFFVANDTILIDSEEGSRTLTKHRVEK
ncbi:MAG: LPS export ABC transporter periplasmic protein LptC [Candidatus Acidiferrales bacterium]